MVLVFKEFMDSLPWTYDKPIGECSDRGSSRSTGLGLHLEDGKEECAGNRQELRDRMGEAIWDFKRALNMTEGYGACGELKKKKSQHEELSGINDNKPYNSKLTYWVFNLAEDRLSLKGLIGERT